MIPFRQLSPTFKPVKTALDFVVMSSKTFTLPWDAWYSDTPLAIPYPDEWQVDVFSLGKTTPVDEEAITREAEGLFGSIGQQQPQSIAIAVDDLTRPMSYRLFFEFLLEKLAGFEKTPQVTIIIGLGTHRPLDRRELEIKVGAAPFRHPFVQVINHDYRNDVIPVDLEWGKIPVKINKHFIEAEFRVVLSAIVPHPFAGFSGGPKMVLPGLSNIEVTRRTHQMALMGFVGKIGNVRENKFRKILDEFIQKIPVDYFIGFLTGEHRECLYVKGGDLLETYYALTDFARDIYTSSLPETTYDVVWLNAYPKDTELLQIDTAFNPLLSAPEKFWHEETIFVVSAACSKGMGVHDLFGPGGLLYRQPREKRLVKGHAVFFFLPGVTPEEFTKVFWEGYPLLSDARKLMKSLQARCGKADVKMAVFPVASVQLVK